jgi:hypothetical protein
MEGPLQPLDKLGDQTILLTNFGAEKMEGPLQPLDKLGDQTILLTNLGAEKMEGPLQPLDKVGDQTILLTNNQVVMKRIAILLGLDNSWGS